MKKIFDAAIILFTFSIILCIITYNIIQKNGGFSSDFSIIPKKSSSENSQNSVENNTNQTKGSNPKKETETPTVSILNQTTYKSDLPKDKLICQVLEGEFSEIKNQTKDNELDNIETIIDKLTKNSLNSTQLNKDESCLLILAEIELLKKQQTEKQENLSLEEIKAIIETLAKDYNLTTESSTKVFKIFESFYYKIAK